MLLNINRLKVLASYLEEAGGISLTRWNMMNSKEKKDYVKKHPNSKYAKWDMFKKDIDNDGMFYKENRNKKIEEPKKIEDKKDSVKTDIPSVKELNKELNDIKNKYKKIDELRKEENSLRDKLYGDEEIDEDTEEKYRNRLREIQREIIVLRTERKKDILNSSFVKPGLSFSYNYSLKKEDGDDDEKMSTHKVQFININDKKGLEVNDNRNEIVEQPVKDIESLFDDMFETEITESKSTPIIDEILPENLKDKQVPNYIYGSIYDIDESLYKKQLDRDINSYIKDKYFLSNNVSEDRLNEAKKRIADIDSYLSIPEFKKVVDEKVNDRKKELEKSLNDIEKEDIKIEESKRNDYKKDKADAIAQIKSCIDDIDDDFEKRYIGKLMKVNNIKPKDIMDSLFKDINLEKLEKEVQEKSREAEARREKEKQDKIDLKNNVRNNLKDKIINKNYAISQKEIEQMLSKCQAHNKPTYDLSSVKDNIKDGDYKEASNLVADKVDNYYKNDLGLAEVVENNAQQVIKLLGLEKNNNKFSFSIDGKKAQENENIGRAEKILKKLLKEDLFKMNTVHVDSNSVNSRAHCETAGNISISKYDDISTVCHEMMHALEFNNPRISEASKQFLLYRTRNDKLKSMRAITKDKGWKTDEKAKADNFFEPYCGKIYTKDNNDTNNTDTLIATEIMSMGLTELLEHPREFYKKDPEYFNFVLMNLKGEI